MAIVMRPRIRRCTSKMLNRKVEYEGFLFDSIKEMKRYCQLRLAQGAGLILHLDIHPEYELVVNGISVSTYTPDFRYLNIQENKVIVEDVKSDAARREKKKFSTKTEGYRMRKKLMLAIYGIEVREI